VWVTESGLGQVAVLDPATFQVVATFPAGVRPVGITSGVDDAVWVADNGGNAVLRIAPDGTLTTYPAPTPDAGVNGVALGPRGDVWFTESRASRIGRVAVGDPHTQYTTVRAVVTEPAPPRLKVGSAMQWTFTGPGVHSVTDASGLALFDSGPRSFVTAFAHVFTAAGDYPFRSSTSRLGGVVKVLPTVAAQAATSPTTITVTWATGPADPGFAYDVQVRRPGESAFHPWQSGAAQASAQLSAPGPGTYAFQARLVSLSQPGAGPGWSPTASVRLG
jgi:plastocyanin